MGSLVCVVLWLCSMMITSYLDPPSLVDTNFRAYTALSLSAKGFSSLLPTCALYWAFKIISFREFFCKSLISSFLRFHVLASSSHWLSPLSVFFFAAVGARWSNIADPAVHGDNISLLTIILIMVASLFMYSFLIFYLDNVIPWQFGVPKSPFFLFQISFWCPSREPNLRKRAQSIPEKFSPMFESPASSNVEPSIVLHNITKTFNQTKAVDNISFSFLSSQISVLLGRSGAGKTTTMNILTGSAAIDVYQSGVP